MQDDQDMPPPLPPQPLGITPPPLPGRRAPARVAPLEYSRPRASDQPGNTFYHQAAKAAWVAPLVALLLGCLTRNTDHSVSVAIGFVNIALIVGGFALAIVAFCGIKRYGPGGLLAPAIAGLCINLLFIVSMGYFLYFTRSKAVARVAAARALATRAWIPFSSPQSSLRQTGWLGVVVNKDVLVSLVSMQDGHADTRAMRSGLKNDASIIIVAIDNRKGETTASLDTRNAQLVFSDGRKVAALDPLTIAYPADLPSLTPPFQVAPGGIVEGKMLFIPPDLDLTKLESVTLTLSGQQIEVPGHIYTAAEKTRLYQMGQQKQQQQP